MINDICLAIYYLNHHQVIGKVSLRKKELHKYHGKEHWFPILPLEANSEVQVCEIIELVFN